MSRNKVKGKEEIELQNSHDLISEFASIDSVAQYLFSRDFVAGRNIINTREKQLLVSAIKPFL